ncbi:hypothetical protein V5O48_013412, partial [Marasmius crinis-equi]
MLLANTFSRIIQAVGTIWLHAVESPEAYPKAVVVDVSSHDGRSMDNDMATVSSLGEVVSERLIR